MKLSEIQNINLNVYQDGYFFQVSDIYSQTSNRLVTVKNEEELIFCLKNLDISGIIVTPDLLPLPDTTKGIVLSENPDETAGQILHNLFRQTPSNRDFKTYIHPTARVNHTANISPYGVKIGKNVEIREYTIILPGTNIEDNVIIDPHSQIGVMESIKTKNLYEQAQRNYGSIIIHKGVYIHPHCSVEIPVFPEITEIGTNCQIDSLTTIHAGVSLGSYSLVAGLVSIGKYANIGERTWIGPGCSISPGVRIGESCFVTLGSKVKKNIPSNKIIKDNWAVDREKFKGIIS